MIRYAKTAVVFGGTGFIGRQIVRELARRGVLIKVATRIPESAYFLRPDGTVGQIVPVACDYTSDSIHSLVKGCDYVVNCIGILYEKGHSKFQRAHVEIPQRIAEACAAENVAHFVHISALACERSTSRYAKSKRAGEEAVMQAFPQATILRPSVVFGEDDSFFNMFAEMARYLPCLPLIGGGRTKFQPVYVGDVALAVMRALDSKDTCGKIFELGGPETVTFKEIYTILAQETGRTRMLVPVPMPIAKIQGFFMQMLPHPPLTPDQVESLKTDNVVTAEALTFKDLEIAPTAMEMVLPNYLECYRVGGRFASRKAA
ncbi:MAG: complex I NDUFA9 subunit family protein [Rhodospirillales bacterium]|nr:complex I NDUFA9 subunit family protein [Rhodospirillales bacterium]MCB9979878.1 complex I NDUFA9 subunit family protein [Rhodospirillales bacterium]